MGILEIVTGFKALYTGKAFNDKVVRKRVETCLDCRYLVKGYPILHKETPIIKEIKGYLCNSCKCYLAAKILSKKSKCPENKW